MSYRGWLLAAGLLASGGPLGADKEFPIGAWFPGMIEGETTTRDGAPTATDRLVWDMRLDMVKAADFNTIHARRGRGQFADTPIQPTLDGPGPREGPEGAAAQLAAAGGVDGEQPQLLDADLFAYPIGGEVTEGDRVVRYAKEDRLPVRPSGGHHLRHTISCSGGAPWSVPAMRELGERPQWSGGREE